MTYKIRYAPMAQRDMDEIWEGVWESSRDYDTADRYLDELADVIAKMKKSPKTGIPLYYRGLFTGYYSVNYKAYKAFYRINGQFIEIIRVLLSRMDYLKVIFGEND